MPVTWTNEELPPKHTGSCSARQWCLWTASGAFGVRLLLEQ